MAKLVVMNREDAGAEIDLPCGVIRLGRAADNDICLTAASISSHHCELAVAEFEVRVRDLGSTNGTFVDRRPAAEAVLRDGQVLGLGNVELRVVCPLPDIRIPVHMREEEPQARLLADGRAACLHHPTAAADFTCLQCGKQWCGECSKELHLVGGRARHFCPACSGRCQRIVPEAPPRPVQTHLRRAWATVKRGFTWRTPKR
ncbi:MAG: FHA domain-containing protein [Verrucomicrobiae bacterium]|nr:FHA domain-containing protein [Verrucomicrobiae bacterium]MCP5517558.1 FHA domain-containing protein [Verrucomicrobiales bacterium]MCP5526326.1 FHA domain-containing protein [Verrucomicrobiales bacterium]